MLNRQEVEDLQNKRKEPDPGAIQLHINDSPEARRATNEWNAKARQNAPHY